MTFESYDDVIRFAISREEAAVRSYDELSGKAKSPGLREMLIELRDEEKKHQRMLENMTREKIASLKVKKVMDLKISDYMVEERLDEDMNFQELLIYAAQKEQRAADLYTELADRAGDAELKKMFLFMAEQEKGHKLKLEKDYDEFVLWED